MHQFQTGDVPGRVFYDNLQMATGWTFTRSGEWQIATPQGLGGGWYGYRDPSDPFSGTRVLGNDLTGMGSYYGDYEPNITTEAIASSPDINARHLNSVKLLFRRWLGVETAVDDHARVLLAAR